MAVVVVVVTSGGEKIEKLVKNKNKVTAGNFSKFELAIICPACARMA